MIVSQCDLYLFGVEFFAPDVESFACGNFIASSEPSAILQAMNIAARAGIADRGLHRVKVHYHGCVACEGEVETIEAGESWLAERLSDGWTEIRVAERLEA